MLLKEKSTKSNFKKYFKKRLLLSGGHSTSVHVGQYQLNKIAPKIVSFSQPTLLFNYCQENGYSEAINGGFFDRKNNRSLGEVWIDGKRQPHTSFLRPWHLTRPCFLINDKFELSIRKRQDYTDLKNASLIQAGPWLVSEGVSLIKNTQDPDGFSSGNIQFDSDITVGRYPRAAVGYNGGYFFTVVCDGRNDFDAGLSLSELADFLIELGALEAINLDGGASATLIAGGEIKNNPRGVNDSFPKGRKIYSAIIIK